MRKIELVTHVWRYSRVFNYQLSSLALHRAPSARITISVYYSPTDDPTVALLDWFQAHHIPRSDGLEPVQHVDEKEDGPAGLSIVYHNINLERYSFPESLLLRRAIGRNYAALKTEADLVWFIDGDYYLGPNCLETLATIELPDDKLFYPRTTMIHKTHALGDEYALRAAAGPGIYQIDPTDFKPEHHAAIGGAQIVPGDVCREFGYCKGDEKRLAPVTDGKWKKTGGDVAFRKSLGTKGTAIDLPNIYRIRQTTEGVVDTL